MSLSRSAKRLESTERRRKARCARPGGDTGMGCVDGPTYARELTIVEGRSRGPGGDTAKDPRISQRPRGGRRRATVDGGSRARGGSEGPGGMPPKARTLTKGRPKPMRATAEAEELLRKAQGPGSEPRGPKDRLEIEGEHRRRGNTAPGGRRMQLRSRARRVPRLSEVDSREVLSGIAQKHFAGLNEAAAMAPRGAFVPRIAKHASPARRERAFGEGDSSPEPGRSPRPHRWGRKPRAVVVESFGAPATVVHAGSS